VPPFPVDVLPPLLADQVREVARVTQTPPDLAGTSGLVVTSASVSRRVDVAIGLPDNPTHLEPLNLFGACVSASGTRKGPAQRAMSRPLRTVERELWSEQKATIEDARRARKLAEKRLERLMDQAARADDAEDRHRLSDEARGIELPLVPPVPKLIVGDRTSERLEVDLAEQGGALLLEDEEAGTLFANAMGRYTQDGTPQLDVYLKGYDRGAIDTGRIGRDAVHVETAELSINVTPQPIILERLRDRPELHDRGFLPRILFAVPPSLIGSRDYDASVAPTAPTRTAYDAMIRRLCALPKHPDGEELPHLQITGPALAVWKAYHDRVEHEMRDSGRLAPIREWASKQPGRVARFAGILHLIGTVGGGAVLQPRIQATTVEAACRLGEYFEAHALVAYDLMRALPEIERARRVVVWLRERAAEGVLTGSVSERDIARGVDVGHSPLFATMDDVRPCVRLLVDYGYLRPQPPPERKPPGGRPASATYDVHPEVRLPVNPRHNRQNPPDERDGRGSVGSVGGSGGIATHSDEGSPPLPSDAPDDDWESF
jgi:replicative DNA helicase